MVNTRADTLGESNQSITKTLFFLKAPADPNIITLTSLFILLDNRDLLLYSHFRFSYIFQKAELVLRTPGTRGDPLAHSTIMFVPQTVRPFS